MTEQIHYETHSSLTNYKGVRVLDRFLDLDRAAKEFDELKTQREYKYRELTLVRVTVNDTHSLVEPLLTKKADH